MEELLVRDYNTNDTRNTFIIADLNALDTGAAKEQSAAKPKSEKSAQKRNAFEEKGTKGRRITCRRYFRKTQKSFLRNPKSFSSERKEFARRSPTW